MSSLVIVELWRSGRLLVFETSEDPTRASEAEARGSSAIDLTHSALLVLNQPRALEADLLEYDASPRGSFST